VLVLAAQTVAPVQTQIVHKIAREAAAHRDRHGQFAAADENVDPVVAGLDGVNNEFGTIEETLAIRGKIVGAASSPTQALRWASVAPLKRSLVL
jgi:hypothetical protein